MTLAYVSNHTLLARLGCDGVEKRALTMNRKQKICLWLGIAVIVLMGLFPPWLVVRGYFYASEKRHVEYWCIFAPPSHTPAEIVTDYLFAQWLMVAAVTGGLIITFQDKRTKGS